ncbi:UTP--glucose-1-phosphate uridylyltransferase, partial [Bacteriovoracaceae bacterium]|nr:UTP--glucose-1-phosphate uridylyltransferase [Bacteriovoracaceae bacterium]
TQNLNDFFQKLGLRESDNPALFNTNTILINYNIFLKKLEKLKGSHKDHLIPDLILNKKLVKESSYVQLEGALASVVFNFDRFWRKTFNEPLVHIVNIPKSDRLNYFRPIKSAFDYFLFFHSDRFSLDPSTMGFIEKINAPLPDISLQDSYYQDVTNILKTFSKTSIVNLTKLSISGKVDLSKFTLQGRVIITNKGAELISLSKLLHDEFPNTTLSDQEIIIERNGSYSFSSLANEPA